MTPRLSDFLEVLKQKKLDGFIVTNPANIFYLCGFKGISPTEREAILIFSLKPTLITARLYQNEARRLKSKNLSVRIVTERNQIFEIAKNLFKVGSPIEASTLCSKATAEDGLAKVGFEEEDLKVSELREFKKTLSPVKLVPTKNFIEDLRIIKSAEEIQRIEKAQIISQKAFGVLVKTVKVGQTEMEIAERLAKIIKSLGGQSLSFESIVAAGPNAALPHYFTGSRKIKRGDVLLLDFGAKYKDYCADISRTIFVGKVDTQKQHIWQLVAKAQKETIKSISPKIKASDAYYKAHGIFKKQKLHKYFLHGLGHGIGLEVHERPYLRQTIDDVLTEGMIFSVEPGLYFPSWGGVRIEDLVVIKNGKAKIIGKLTEEIIII